MKSAMTSEASAASATGCTRSVEAEKSHPMRRIGPYVDDIWWIELGSDHDIFADQEISRHTLFEVRCYA